MERLKKTIKRILQIFKQPSITAEGNVPLPYEIKKIANVIGREAAIKLWERYAGYQIYIPRGIYLDKKR